MKGKVFFNGVGFVVNKKPDEHHYRIGDTGNKKHPFKSIVFVDDELYCPQLRT